MRASLSSLGAERGGRYPGGAKQLTGRALGPSPPSEPVRGTRPAASFGVTGPFEAEAGATVTSETVRRGGETAAERRVAADFASWRSIMQNRFVPLQLTPARDDAPFAGEVTSRAFGELHVSHVRSDAHLVRRLPQSIRLDDPRFVKLSLQLDGVSEYTQDGRSAEVGPGDLVIYDTTRPYAVDSHARVESFILMMPPSALSLSREHIDLLTARRIAADSAVGEIAQPFLRQFAQRFEEFGAEDGGRLIRAFLGLVDAVLHHELATLGARPNDFDRVRDYIERHLCDEDLTPARIAQEHFISLRSLQYLFQDRGTSVSQYLRNERLARCSLDLASPALRDEPVGRIAARYGFFVPASFSRLFKQRFGAAPAEWRRRALGGTGREERRSA